VKRGETFLVLRLFQQAKTDFEHAAALDPANAGAWRGIGLANYFSYDFKSAHEAFVKAGEAFAISGRAQTDSRNAAEIAAWDELATGRIDPPPIAFSVGSGYPVTDGQQEFAAYIEGWNRRRDTEAALPVWRRVADSKNWPLLWVIAAEAEIAAVEGPKKVIPAV
jgi:hypothetical protein